ncbi:MAG: type I-C CRISPR-associated protein Cas7/Csd2 [Chloroflexi bacterium]|nr:type I-C CRISPR-associated protein Cas7/Csd2 [Chloroflexota bacterium]
MSQPIRNRYEFVLFYDVENGNPNGDPDAGNLPRIDPETGHGIVTDVCLKRKIRNYVELVKGDEPGYKIYVKENIPLNNQHELAYIANGIELPKKTKKGTKEAGKGEKEEKVDPATIRILRAWMCENFYDIRTFGAVMNTKVPAGIVRGPVQINFSCSVDPIIQQEVTITRVTVTRPEDDKDTEIGRKMIVPYGLYRVEGCVSAKLANDPTKGTGFSEEDLKLFWDALINMFEHDHSASRGKMSARKLFIFKHDSELGNGPAHKLFDAVCAERVDSTRPPRSFNDYVITLDQGRIPAGVTVIERE